MKIENDRLWLIIFIIIPVLNERHIHSYNKKNSTSKVY